MEKDQASAVVRQTRAAKELTLAQTERYVTPALWTSILAYQIQKACALFVLCLT